MVDTLRWTDLWSKTFQARDNWGPEGSREQVRTISCKGWNAGDKQTKKQDTALFYWCIIVNAHELLPSFEFKFLFLFSLFAGIFLKSHYWLITDGFIVCLPALCALKANFYPVSSKQ